MPALLQENREDHSRLGSLRKEGIIFMKTAIQLPKTKVPDDELPNQEAESPRTAIPGRQYIRIFKETTDPEVWKSYCLGFGLDPKTTTSFKICNIDTAQDVQVDLYTIDGELAEMSKYCCIPPRKEGLRDDV